MVMVVIGILSSLVLISTRDARERTYETSANAEMNTMANAVRLYVQKYNEYPDDVNRDIPSVLNEFLDVEEDWPDAPWPGSVFDYENWDGGDTIQISIRFCPIGGPLGDCQFPDEPWVTANWDVQSSAFFCIYEAPGSGSCRSHSSRPVDHPGHCVNCGGNHPSEGQ